MIKKKIFIATAVFASICMLGGCATSKSSKKAAEATTEAAQQAKASIRDSQLREHPQK